MMMGHGPAMLDSCARTGRRARACARIGRRGCLLRQLSIARAVAAMKPALIASTNAAASPNTAAATPASTEQFIEFRR